MKQLLLAHHLVLIVRQHFWRSLWKNIYEMYRFAHEKIRYYCPPWVLCWIFKFNWDLKLLNKTRNCLAEIFLIGLFQTNIKCDIVGSLTYFAFIQNRNSFRFNVEVFSNFTSNPFEIKTHSTLVLTALISMILYVKQFCIFT